MPGLSFLKQWFVCFPVSCVCRSPPLRPLLKDAPDVSHGCGPRGPLGPPHSEEMHEVSVIGPGPAGPGAVTGEVRRTISLPEECSKLRAEPTPSLTPRVQRSESPLFDRKCFHHVFSGCSKRNHSFCQVSDQSGLQPSSK